MGNQRINRIELRSEVAGAVQNPQENVTVTEAQAAGDIWLRLTKAGNSYTGEYSFDGTTWMAFPGGAVANPMANPDFGLFAFAPQASGVGETVSFDYFTLDGQDPPSGCECVAGPGDEFDGAALDKTKWNAIVREDEASYEVSDGALRITTVAGDIYTNGDPASTRNFILQQAPAGDWVIETKVSGDMSGGYEHGGLMVRQDDDNYIKFDVISDENQTIKNRIELRSEVAAAIQEPQPQVTKAAPGYGDVWLRLTKTARRTRASSPRTARRGRPSAHRSPTRRSRRRRSACSPWVSTARAPPSCSTTSPSTAARAASRRRRRTTRRRSGTSRRRRPSARARCR